MRVELRPPEIVGLSVSCEVEAGYSQVAYVYSRRLVCTHMGTAGSAAAMPQLLSASDRHSPSQGLLDTRPALHRSQWCTLCRPATAFFQMLPLCLAESGQKRICETVKTPSIRGLRGPLSPAGQEAGVRAIKQQDIRVLGKGLLTLPYTWPAE